MVLLWPSWPQRRSDASVICASQSSFRTFRTFRTLRTFRLRWVVEEGVGDSEEAAMLLLALRFIEYLMDRTMGTRGKCRPGRSGLLRLGPAQGGLGEGTS